MNLAKLFIPDNERVARVELIHRLSDVIISETDRKREAESYMELSLLAAGIQAIPIEFCSQLGLAWNLFYINRKITGYINTFSPLVDKDIQYS